MTIIQAKAVDNLGGSTTLANTYPTGAISGNYRFKLICTRPSNGTALTSVVESPGSVSWTQQTTNIDDPDFVGTNALQVWAPSSFGSTTSCLTTISASVAGIEFFIEDDEIDTAVGFLGGIIKDNSVGADPWVTTGKSFTGDVVVYEITSTGAGDSVGYTAGAGRTAVTGTNITTGHHGNTNDGDDVFVQRRVVIGGGTLSASGGNPSLVSANSALYAFRKKAAAGGGSSDTALLMLL